MPGAQRTISLANLTAGGPSTIGPALAQPHAPVESLYIHIPFCFHKCHYCDFYSIVDEHDRQEAFLQRLILELRALAPHAGKLRTIFIGGGTPSLLRVNLWKRLLDELGRLFDLSAIRSGFEPQRPQRATEKQTRSIGSGNNEPQASQHFPKRPPKNESPDPPSPSVALCDLCGSNSEFTVECNPETVTPELAATLRAGGVDRISMGAQSFDLRHLKTLERWHDPESVERSIEVLRAAGMPRLSIDLIFAIPGQTLEEWHADLRRAVALGTTHLSCYNLTYEPNTAMTARLRRGEFTPTDEELEAQMYTATVETLAAPPAGFSRYEVSNYARPGSESRHNLVYWRNADWLAAGPGAAGHVSGWRWKNAPNLREYLDSGSQLGGFAPAIDIEPPDAARSLRERIMMGIRIREGLDAPSLLADAAAIDVRAGARMQRSATTLAADGLLESRNDRWMLTDAGFLCADHVAAELMQTLA